MNMNSGQDNSSIELWKAQQARVLSNDSIAVDYFCVSKSILNNIVLEKIKNEIYEYIHDLKAVLDEPYLIFKESGVAYFGNEVSFHVILNIELAMVIRKLINLL